MQYTKDQHDISYPDRCHAQHFFHIIYFIPCCKADGDVAEINQIITSQKNPVDCQTQNRIMNEIIQIKLS